MVVQSSLVRRAIFKNCFKTFPKLIQDIAMQVTINYDAFRIDTVKKR